MALKITENIIIDDIDEVIARMQEAVSPEVFDLDSMVNFIRNEATAKFYFDQKMQGKAEGDRAAVYLWLDTGYVSQRNRTIFISLLKNEYNGTFVGSWVGDYYRLFNNAAKFFASNRKVIFENMERFQEKYDRKIEKRTQPHLNMRRSTNPVCSDVFGSIKEQIVNRTAEHGHLETMSLFDTPSDVNKMEKMNLFDSTNKEEKQPEYIWEKTAITLEVFNNLLVHNWKTEKGLDRYLKTIGTRLAQLIDRGEDRYYVLNKYKDAIVNTGIMDKFGNDFLVLYRMNLSGKFSEYGNYKPEKLIRSKADFIANEFTKDQAIRGIIPISFIDDDAKDFCPSIEDFDLDTKDLCHMIEERRSRFPDNLQSVSSVEVTGKLRNELMMGLRMLQHDRSYVKLLYSAKCGKTMWLLPFHINTSIMEDPELVMVITKSNEFYHVKTIFVYNDYVKDKITALSLYSKVW